MDALLYKKYQEVESNYWWFVGRRKIIFDILKRYVPNPESAKIFDFGCNTGFLVGELQRRGYDAYGVDVSASAIEYGHSQGIANIAIYNPDNFKEEKDMFPDMKFDIILSLDVIEHIEDDVDALMLLRYKLAPRGKIIVMVPAFMFLWGLQDKVAHHFRRYTRTTLRAAGRDAGLVIDRITYFNIFLFFPIAVVRLLRKVFPTFLQKKSDFDLNPPFINRLFTKIFCAEAGLLKWTGFPFGVSLLAVLSDPCFPERRDTSSHHNA